MHHLPRLDPEHYRGFAAVLWTITFERRATGWLDPLFHAGFRELLLHAAAREQLFCPAYVLMPDHIHVFWLGLKLYSDQRNAMPFLRKHLQAELTRRSPHGVEFELQKQPHDSVLRERDRTRGALSRSCFCNCSGVGQTSGLPVHGASGSVNLMAAKLRARGPVNRQTRGLPHTPT
jgi:hypothetical protein